MAKKHNAVPYSKRVQDIKDSVHFYEMDGLEDDVDRALGKLLDSVQDYRLNIAGSELLMDNAAVDFENALATFEQLVNS